MNDVFNARDVLKVGDNEYSIYRLDALEKAGLVELDKLPYSIRILLENALRQCNDVEITFQDIKNIAAWSPNPVHSIRPSIPFLPSRVLMHDLTGLPAVVDLAAMRDAVAGLGGDPRIINPLIPADLVIDHSIQVDVFGRPDAIQRNTELEFQRNRERYEFLKWGQKAFENFRVIPPSSGILHQVNLEYLSEVVGVRSLLTSDESRETLESVLFPDTLVGTDSHTPMINGLGVVGWGVGGIEAEAVMLGQPVNMLLPDVIGFKLHGRLAEGVTATDLVLTITQMLRKKGVVDKFVEFSGPGLDDLPLSDRATIANMAPEYGATMGYFPVDAETMRYLRLSGRSEELIMRIEAYCRAQGLFREEASPTPQFTDMLELDLGSVTASLAGPKRPQDRVPLSAMQASFQAALTAPVTVRGYELTPAQLAEESAFDTSHTLKNGSVVIAAITACTNTSNPYVMLAAGLLAKKAVELGLSVKPYVKTSLAPGSRVVTEYLASANLLEPLAQLGFDVVGYGCTTCVGNSGPLPAAVEQAIKSQDLVVAAVLSGNRNFEGRVHPLTRANYLASPPLVVAYAISGTVDIDLTNDSLGQGTHGPVYLRDIWPTNAEVVAAVQANLSPEMFTKKYADILEGDNLWQKIAVSGGERFTWSNTSTYIHCPPYFDNFSLEAPTVHNIENARCLAVFGDSITTDHIIPSGNVAPASPAGKFLQERGIEPIDFNTYGSRRGSDEVMVRGTFGNIRLKNRMVARREGGWTKDYSGQLAAVSTEEMSIYDAAMRYKQAGIPAIILAGKEYGTGSSRDWAAKGTALLGVKAVIAESFERIHRSNLIGMGVLPLCFTKGQTIDSLGLDGSEVFDIEGVNNEMPPQSVHAVKATKPDGKQIEFKVISMLNTALDVNYYRNGGILPAVLRKLVGS
jgi:aconitate hydratase